MVEHEGQFRQQGGRSGGCGQLVGPDYQVVDETGGGDGPQTAQDVGAQQPLGVGFATDTVPDSDEPVTAGQGTERGEGVGDVRGGEVGPADHARDEGAAVGEG